MPRIAETTTQAETRQQKSAARNQQMRIVIVSFESPHDIMGGVQRRVSAEISYFARQNADVTVIYRGKEPETRSGSIRYIPVQTGGSLYPIQTLLFSIRSASLISKMDDLDVLETHHDAGLAGLLLPFFFHRLPCHAWVEFIHGVFLDEWHTIRKTYPFFSKAVFRASALLPLSWLERQAARAANEVVVVSRYAAEKTHTLYRVPQNKIKIIPNGIDETIFHPTSSAQIQSVQKNPGVKRFLFVGRLDPRKGILIMLRAFSKACAKHSHIELDVIGSGQQKTEAQQLCQSLGISDQVHFLGHRTDYEVAHAYRSAYAVCIPSLQEGQGITSLEAQACGTPVIISDAGGLPETILPGQTGLLTRCGDTDSLAAAICQLAADEKQRSEMSSHALRWSQQFHWTVQLSKAWRLYRNAGVLHEGPLIPEDAG